MLELLCSISEVSLEGNFLAPKTRTRGPSLLLKKLMDRTIYQLILDRPEVVALGS